MSSWSIKTEPQVLEQRSSDDSHQWSWLDLERKATERVLTEPTYAKTSAMKTELPLNNITITILTIIN